MNNNHAPSTSHHTDYILLAVGVALILLPLVFVVVYSGHVDVASVYLRIIASIGGALVGTALPGVLQITLPGIRAAGALAVLVLFWQFDPPQALYQAITTDGSLIQHVVLCTTGLPEDCTQPLGRTIVAGCPSKAEGERADSTGKTQMPDKGWLTSIPVEKKPVSMKVVGARLLKSSVVRGVDDDSLIVQPPQPGSDGKSIIIQCFARKDSAKATVQLDIGVDLQ
jgi:hypothetical protein